MIIPMTHPQGVMATTLLSPGTQQKGVSVAKLPEPQRRTSCSAARSSAGLMSFLQPTRIIGTRTFSRRSSGSQYVRTRCSVLGWPAAARKAGQGKRTDATRLPLATQVANHERHLLPLTRSIANKLLAANNTH